MPICGKITAQTGVFFTACDTSAVVAKFPSSQEITIPLASTGTFGSFGKSDHCMSLSYQSPLTTKPFSFMPSTTMLVSPKIFTATYPCRTFQVRPLRPYGAGLVTILPRCVTLQAGFKSAPNSIVRPVTKVPSFAVIRRNEHADAIGCPVAKPRITKTSIREIQRIRFTGRPPFLASREKLFAHYISPFLPPTPPE